MRSNDEPMHRWVVRSVGFDQHGTPFEQSIHVMHLCDNPSCYRYDHLRLGTHADNMADMKAKGRRLQPITHGTDGGYQAHLRRSEAACPECCAAHARKSRKQRAVKLEVHS